jgi:hypothetical protein
VPDPARPPLVLPLTHGRAIDDPNTALLQQIRTRTVRRMILPVLCLALLCGVDYLSATAGLVPDLVYLGILTALLIASVGFTLWVHEPQRRRGRSLLSRYGWRPVPAAMLSDNPCLARVILDGTEVTLRLTRLNWIGKQAVLRTGTLWICGPDERGRALARVAGSVGQAMADVTDARPSGMPPVLAVPSGPRPGDDPALIWARRSFGRTMLIFLAVMVLLTGVSIGFVTKDGFGHLGVSDSTAFGGLVAAPVMLILLVWAYVAGLRSSLRYARAAYWQAVPVSLDTWDAPANVAIRTGTGRVILPGGWQGYADFPRLTLDFAANLRATGVLWLAGEPAPGATVPIGLPGYPLRGVVKIRR